MKRQVSLHAFALMVLMGTAADAQTPGGEIFENRTFRFVQGQQGPQQLSIFTVVGGNDRRAVRIQTGGGAWWTNAALVAGLGLSDDQKARIERVFENHRPNLELNRATLEKEEAQLARLLESEPFDRNGALSQTFRVIQARSDLERTNALMTLEMREYLTRAQWVQVPQPSLEIGYTIKKAPLAIQTAPTPPGARGGARGGGQQ